jgi:hypothetical protein
MNTNFPKRPFILLAYICNVIALHTPNDDQSISYGEGPRSRPLELIGSSAIKPFLSAIISSTSLVKVLFAKVPLLSLEPSNQISI